MRVTLGTDDPPYFGATLDGEYDVCSEHFGWDDQLRAVTGGGDRGGVLRGTAARLASRTSQSGLA